MPESVAIELELVSKKYCRSLKRSMLYGMSDITRNVCGLGSRPERLRRDEFFALSDVSFSVRRGEILGVIGPNGSGKTTLLKLLNGIFWPDTGTIDIRGRVGALIEVGAGFHPLLSGRENVYVNASILGMTRAEVDERFDSIVDFADVGDFIDSPVKFYSSGMFVRLGFAVAVHCRPDILLIDEVLAVGDAAFRRKATERMQEIRAGGTTILFVSHDMNRVEGFCDTGVYIQDGRIESAGEIGHVIADYQKALMDPETLEQTDRVFRQVLQRERMIAETYNTREIEVANLRIVDIDGRECRDFSTGDTLRVVCDVEPKTPISNWLMSLMIRRSDGVQCIVERSRHQGIEHPPLDGPTTITATFEQLQLTAGTFVIHVAFSDRGLVQPVGRRGGRDIFTVRDSIPNPDYREGVYHPEVRWEFS